MSDAPKVTLESEEGVPLPSVAELITRLTGDYGTEYTMMLARAVESANRDDQPRYRDQLDEATSILARTLGPVAKEVAIGHVGSVLAAVHVDLRNFAAAEPPRPSAGQLKQIHESMRAAGWTS